MNALDAALRLLNEGFWPVPITPWNDPAAKAPGKQPIGFGGWGIKRHTPETLASIYDANPSAGVGIKLGPDGQVVDFDIDDPEKAKETLGALFGGEVPETRGWSSARGYHWIFFWDQRLAKYGKSIINLPGMELRLGTPDGKQIQSVVPPSIGSDGKPRQWNGHTLIIPLPESVFDYLDAYFAPKPIMLPAPTNRSGSSWDTERRAVAYLQKCQPAVSGEKGHDQAFKVACKVGPGFDLPMAVALKLITDHYNPACQPPWSEKELYHKVENAYESETRRGWIRDTNKPGYEPRGGSPNVRTEADAEPLPSRNRTDLGNAERLVDQHGPDMRYCHPWKKWLTWDGRRWKVDDTGEPERRARATARTILNEANAETDDDKRKDIVKWAFSSEGRDKLSAMISLAAAEPGIPILIDEMDVDKWLFNVRNGTIDLRTGLLRNHHRNNLITKLCNLDFDPDATCPLWIATLEKFFARADTVQRDLLIGYWQRVCGYALVGVVEDHILPIAYGKGSNGKSTILGTLLDVFGSDYAMKANSGMFMAKKNDGHPTEKTSLFGKRLVIAIETEEGHRLNETMIKEATGGDSIRARRMREDEWEFKPSHTLIMATNHKPKVHGTDYAIWRRLKLVPFTVTMTDAMADKAMPAKLKAEASGILAWLVRGCLEWRDRGLDAPAEVLEATAAYQREQDAIGGFLEECTLQDPSVRVKAGELFKRYVRWAESRNEKAVNMTEFGNAMTERGIEKKTSNGVWYSGVGIRIEAENDATPKDTSDY